jgi:hypothetical protein
MHTQLSFAGDICLDRPTLGVELEELMNTLLCYCGT